MLSKDPKVGDSSSRKVCSRNMCSSHFWWVGTHSGLVQPEAKIILGTLYKKSNFKNSTFANFTKPLNTLLGPPRALQQHRAKQNALKPDHSFQVTQPLGRPVSA